MDQGEIRRSDGSGGIEGAIVMFNIYVLKWFHFEIMPCECNFQ